MAETINHRFHVSSMESPRNFVTDEPSGGVPSGAQPLQLSIPQVGGIPNLGIGCILCFLFIRWFFLHSFFASTLHMHVKDNHYHKHNVHEL